MALSDNVDGKKSCEVICGCVSNLGLKYEQFMPRKW